MEEALLSLLLSDPAVATVLADRIYWVRRPDLTRPLPVCVLQRVSGVRDYTIRENVRLMQSRVQADFFGQDYRQSKEASRAVCELVDGYIGTHAGEQFQRIMIDSERDLNELEKEADRMTFRVSIDLIIWHQKEVN
ncbi:MAG: DUF3168 domain-containing protein [Pseudomonadota bacterium]